MSVGRFVGWAVGLLAVACLALPGRALAGRPETSATTETSRAHRQGAKEIFQTVCATCHGSEGKGNGPAAAALNPHPADFADPEFWKTHTDSLMVHSITNGKGQMPSFGTTYDAATIKALVAYIHVLVGVPQPGSTPPSPSTLR